MTRLTQEHLDFLKRHNILIEEVFDATGMRFVDYKRYMKENDLLLAYGVTPCQKAGHTFRTRYNHCVMCDPSKIAYVKRKRTSGFVYVAVSCKEGLVKIGCAKNYQNRLSNLNSQSYGNINDWRLIAYFHHERMGEAEHNIQKGFEQYQELRTFKKDGGDVQASEIYHIELAKVFEKADRLGYVFEFIDHNLVTCYKNRGVVQSQLEPKKTIDKSDNATTSPIIHLKPLEIEKQTLNSSFFNPSALQKTVGNSSASLKSNVAKPHEMEGLGWVSDTPDKDQISNVLTITPGNKNASQSPALVARLEKQSCIQDEFATERVGDNSECMVQGRLRRLSYFTLSLLVLLIGGLAMTLAHGTLIMYLFWFITMAINAFFSAKRLQDADISPYWAAIMFIPYVCILGWLFFICIPGTRGVNRFGNDPRI